MKKLLSIILAITLLATSMVFAAEGDTAIYINAEKQTEYTPVAGDMIPLRKVCESLGMTVTWDEETSMIAIEKMPIYITCTPYSDGYTFARTAPMMLGQAPVLIDGTTYVPVNFVTEILHLDIDVSEYVINIYEGRNVFTVESDFAQENQIAIYDFDRGEVILNITEETVICDELGNPLTIEDLTPDFELNVFYDETMTMSLPPISNAKKIIRRDELAKTVTEGTVCEIVKDEEGKVKQVVLGEKDDVMSQTILNVEDDIVVIGAEGLQIHVSELTEGTVISALTARIMTMSIPAQIPTLKIRVVQ